MTRKLRINLGTWNAGRTKKKTPAQAKALFNRNCTLVHEKLHDGFGFMQEWDEADLAEEHVQSAKIFAETHRWLQFSQATPVAVPDGFRILRRPQPKTLEMSGGIARWSPHRVLTKGLVAREGDMACRFFVGSTHIMRSHEGEADDLRNLHIRRLRSQFRLAEKRGEGMVIGLDGNTKNLPELHPKQKVLYHRGLDYIIAIDGDGFEFNKVSTRTVDTTIDGHDLGIARVELAWDEGR